MATEKEPGQTESPAQQGGRPRAQQGGNGGAGGGQQRETRERSQEASRSGGGTGRSMTPSRGRQELASMGGSPFESMWQLSREMDRLMSSVLGMASPFGSSFRSMFQPGREEGWSSAPTLWSPRIDVEQREDAFIVRADLPGVRREDLHIEATEDGLTISGERREEREEGGEDQGYRRMERSYGSFFRTIPLPTQKVNLDQLKARMRDGVLQISIPLNESARPRRIQIEE